MGIKRGSWNKESVNKIATISKPGQYGARPAAVPKNGVSNSEQHMATRGVVQESSPIILENVSEYRQEDLIRGTSTNRENDGSNPAPVILYSNSYKRSNELKEQYGFVKNAGIGVADSSRLGGSGSTVRQAPEIYSPLFQIANLQLPRDRITMNAWNRNFYDTHPLVHNCINLHATYPISKLNIKCKDRKIEQFFNDMIERLDLTNKLQEISLEFWKMGEVFPYNELDVNRGEWKDIIIQNPDYMHIKKSVLGGGEVISMRPDASLQRLVQSNSPTDIQLRQQIDPEIIYQVRKGNNIPLDNFHVSHLAMRSAPYDIHGTSLIVSIYKDLMLYDKLRESKFAQADNLVNPITIVKVGGIGEGGEYHPTNDDLEKWRQTFECHDEKTEVLTDQGFREFDEVIDFSKNQDGSFTSCAKPEFKIACFNDENKQLEYHKPSAAHVYDYDGEMCHFKGKNIDVKVTPNHRMFYSKRNYKNRWSDWGITNAGNLLEVPGHCKFRSKIKWTGKSIDTVSIIGKNVPIDDYLRYIGYVLSEGSISVNDKRIDLYQKTDSVCYDDIVDANMSFANHIGKNFNNNIREINGADLWTGRIYSKELAAYFKNEIGNRFCNKYIPRWVLDLPVDKLKILLNALVDGDGSVIKNKFTTGFKYYTASKQLANDVYEIAYKIGFAPHLRTAKRSEGKKHKEYIVGWSDSKFGNFPEIKKGMIVSENYNGKVWCFTVPTGLFITRRNGKITVQGNSAQYDKDFKIISHAAVSVERVGASGQIIDIGNDMTFILDNILYGLLVPKAVVTQDGASFNSATIGLEVLKQRYESFRNMMAQWLCKKVFAPISEIQEFYEYRDGDKKLIIPEVEWNKMVLFDMDNYINILNGLVGQKQVSKKTLFHSLGLNSEEESRRIKEEMIDAAIMAKEQAIVQGMSLGGLRALKPDEDIIEPTEAPLPGTSGSEESGIPGADMGMGGGASPLGDPFGGGAIGLGMPPAGGNSPMPGPGAGDLGSGAPPII